MQTALMCTDTQSKFTICLGNPLLLVFLKENEKENRQSKCLLWKLMFKEPGTKSHYDVIFGTTLFSAVQGKVIISRIPRNNRDPALALRPPQLLAGKLS